MRELKRGGQRTFMAVDFRVPSDEEVWVGHYASKQKLTTVAKAVRYIRSRDDARGYQIIIPRPVTPKEIVKVRAVSRLVGWRYSPTSNGRKPCYCEYCSAGTYGARKLRESASL